MEILCFKCQLKCKRNGSDLFLKDLNFYWYITITALSCNGILLFRKIAIKADFCNHGLAHKFLPLEAYEEEKICQNGVDLVEVCMTLSFVTTDHVNLQI